MVPERLSRLQSYKSHKVVLAARIVGLIEPPASQLELDPGDGGPNIWHEVPGDFFRRHRPAAGGYLVVYEDGYQSFSPAEAFEGGYRLVAELEAEAAAAAAAKKLEAEAAAKKGPSK